MLHSNELNRIVTELSLTRSVFSICPCIQLHKYACNVSQIWFFCFYLYSRYLRTRSLLYCIVTFSRCSSRIILSSNPQYHVGFKIFEHLIARDYDLFQTWTCLHLLFVRPSSARTLVSVRNTRAFQTALMALKEPRTLWRRITLFPSPRRHVWVHWTDVVASRCTWEHLGAR